MADEQAHRSADLADAGSGTASARAGQLESDASARNDELADSLAIHDQPTSDSHPTTDGHPASDVHPAPEGDPVEPTPDETPVAATATEPTPETDGTGGGGGGGGGGTKPPRWQFWRRAGEPKKRKKAPWWELPVLIAVAIAVAVLIKTFLIQPFYIPSESMEKTLHGCPGCSGDRVLVNKLIFDIRDPHPGDIVVFRAPANWDEEPSPKAPSNPLVKGVRWFGQLVGFVPPDEKDLIKRVIASGGQTVQCCDPQGRVQVSNNGVNGPWHSLDEPYIFENLPWDPRNRPGHLISGSNDTRTFGPITIPRGRLWVMGDHRNDSADSRFHCLEESPADHICETTNTTVAVSKVIGKGTLIAWPPSRWRTLGTPSTFKHEADAALPAIGGMLTVLPIFGLRRRRRR
ncbi:MAG TPA: signal peptidase I [Jatrophihabitantaceae bacterium]